MLDRDKIRKNFINRLKTMGRRPSCKKVDDLVDEYLENQKFIEDNNLSVENLPTKEDIKYWFQDPPETDLIEIEPDLFETVFEVDVDDICIDDKLATEVFKWLYKWKWYQGKELPKEIFELIKINNIISKSRNKKNKEKAKARLANICIVGVIRFYHLERNPYLCPTQIVKSVEFLRQSLSFLSKVEKGKYDKKIVNGNLYMFDPFEQYEDDHNGT